MSARRDIDRLIRILRRSRRRWAAFALVHAILVAAVGASAFVAVVTAAGPLRFQYIHLDATVALRVGIAVFVLLVVSTAAWNLRSVPKLVELAARADHVRGLAARLHTALELVNRGSGSLSLVERAAVEDAGLHAIDLRPSQVIWFDVPRWAWLVPLFVTVATVGTLLESSGAGSASAPQIVVDAAKTTDEVSAALVKELVELLVREAEAVEDPYFQAVARDLAAFATTLGDERILDQAGTTELDRLLGHLLRAVSAREDHVGRLLQELAESRLREPEASTADGLLAPPEEFLNAMESIGGAGATTAGTGTAEEREPVSHLLDQLAQTLSARDREASVAADGRAEQEGDCDAETLLYSGECVSVSDIRNAPSGLVQEGDRAGTAVAAAQESDDRAGDAAGDGGQAEFASTGAGVIDIDVLGTELRLPDDGSPSGGPRHEVEGLSGDQAREAKLIEANAAMAAHRSDEGAITSSGSARTYDDVVRRYFLPNPLAAEAVLQTRER